MSVSKFLPAPADAATRSPTEMRDIFRQNGYYGTTSGFCIGHTQANVIMLPTSLADDFERFCSKNSGCFPLLYRSKPGETGAPPLADNTDIKWDLPRYVIYRDGKRVDDMLDLDGFSYLWDDIVCFYTGCSYSFEHVLVDNGIKLSNLEAGKNCSIYSTNIMLEDSGPFAGIKMVVSMRPIRKSLLETVVTVTAKFPHHHGAPVHIGDPVRIGITDVTKPDYGDWQVGVEDDSVFVFWACGVTNGMAVAAARPSLAFSHFPGSMFIADVKPEKKNFIEAIQIIELSRPQDPYFASVVGSKTVDLLSKFEESLLEDPGKRGIAHLFVKSDLIKSVLLLSHSKRVAITTGFPANVDLLEKNETDGICGALSICQALLALGKQVTLISDHSSECMLRSCVENMVSLGALDSYVPVISFKDAKDLVEASQKNSPVYDCFVSIERCGRSANGNYYTMNKNDISMLVDPVDDLFVYAASNPLIGTIGIGDGGNEIGMGKVKDKVVENVKYGDVIACQTSTDFLIAAGISDWGGYAISLGLYAVSQCPIHWRYTRQSINAENTRPFQPSQFLPSNQQVISLLEFMNNSLGILDGITKGCGSVDGLPIKTVLDKVEVLRKLL